MSSRESFPSAVPEEALPPLDTPTRIKFQLQLMYRMHGDTLTDEYVNAWIPQYAEKVANIIDGKDTSFPRDVRLKLRELLVGGDMDDAVDIVYGHLQSHPTTESAGSRRSPRDVPDQSNNTVYERKVA